MDPACKWSGVVLSPRVPNDLAGDRALARPDRGAGGAPADARGGRRIRRGRRRAARRDPRDRDRQRRSLLRGAGPLAGVARRCERSARRGRCRAVSWRAAASLARRATGCSRSRRRASSATSSTPSSRARRGRVACVTAKPDSSLGQAGRRPRRADGAPPARADAHAGVLRRRRDGAGGVGARHRRRRPARRAGRRAPTAVERAIAATETFMDGTRRTPVPSRRGRVRLRPGLGGGARGRAVPEGGRDGADRGLRDPRGRHHRHVRARRGTARAEPRDARRPAARRGRARLRGAAAPPCVRLPGGELRPTGASRRSRRCRPSRPFAAALAHHRRATTPTTRAGRPPTTRRRAAHECRRRRARARLRVLGPVHVADREAAGGRRRRTSRRSRSRTRQAPRRRPRGSTSTRRWPARTT